MTSATRWTMNGVAITRDLGSLADYSFSPNVPTGLEGYWHLGLSVTNATKNLAPGKPNAAVIGVPTFSADGYARFTMQTACLQTEIAETADLTVMFVGRSPTAAADGAQRPAFFGNYTGPSAADPLITSNGVMVHRPDGLNRLRLLGFRRAADGSTTNIGSSNNVATTFTSWDCFVARISGLEVKLTNLTTGATSSFTHSLPRFVGALPLRIGSVYDTASGQVEMAQFSAWSRALSDTEITTAYLQEKAYQLGRFGRVC